MRIAILFVTALSLFAAGGTISDTPKARSPSSTRILRIGTRRKPLTGRISHQA